MTDTVHLFVVDSLADWEPGYAIAGLNKPGMQKRPGRFRVATVAERPDPVTTMGGVRIVPDLTLDQVSPRESAMLILAGADAWDAGRLEAAEDAARRWVAAGVPVAAICGGTTGVAHAGLLNTRRHTSNAEQYLAATGYAGGPYYEDVKAVTSEDGLVITAGSMWPLEFAYEIFKRLDAYDEAVLEAWYGLFSTGDARYFARMMELGQGASAG